MNSLNSILRYIFVFAACLVLYSCTSEQSGNKVDVESYVFDSFNRDLKAWGFDVDVGVTVSQDTLQILIAYRGEDNAGKAPFFYDNYTNELIVKTLLMGVRSQLEPFSLVKLQLTFEGSPDVGHFHLTKDDLNDIWIFFTNESFYTNVKYCLEEFGYTDIVFFNSAIKFVVDGVKGRVKFNGNFWQLLKMVSSCCRKDEESLNSALLFSLIGGLVRNVDYGGEEPVDGDLKFLNILNRSCGEITDSIYSMDISEMQIYLSKSSCL